MLRRYLPLIALTLLGLAFYRQAAFTNLIFARGDTLLYFYPYWDFRNQSLLAGHLPLWNPYLFMGVPFLANSQAGVFYPLNWPLVVFSAPVAVKISIVVHVIIAAWGAYALARRAFDLEPASAFFAAAVFAFGGYLSAQVEHVNQLQGLAWFPLALLAIHHICSNAISRPSSAVLLHCSLFSLFIALQLTAGHAQTTFITLVACGLAVLYNLLVSRFTFERKPGNMQYALRQTIWGFGGLGFGILLAAGIAGIQLLPTFELSRLSLRSGGLPLNEAISFSLNPLLLGRALLPGYSRIIFSEFVGYIGVVPLILATLALTSLRHHRAIQLAVLLVGFGLFFAIGGYNPIYLLLARFVPGFNLFRAPARWLVLWALGSAILAGHGLQKINALLLSQPEDKVEARSRVSAKATVIFLPILFLVALTYLSASLTPPGELGPIGPPSFLDLALWLTPLSLLVLLFVISRIADHASRFGFRHFWASYAWVLGVGLLELFIASRTLPLNHLTTPDSYTSIRPAMTQLLAYQTVDCQLPTTVNCPPARFLSLSQLEFDPGDLAELHSEWDTQLPPDAVYDAIIATKHKEVLSPNLPLVWRVPTVDGFDGGILPLRAYAEFAQQFGDVPDNTDGRLRQFLKTIPSNDLLSLTNTRWIITDKTGDAWIDNIFYDLGLTAAVSSAAPLTLNRIPKFQATALGLVLDENSQEGVAQIELDTGETITAPITFDPAHLFTRLHWEEPATVKQIVILTPTLLTLRGASLIDERTDTFRSLTLGPYRLAHSGDVKIYENLNALPRAFIIESSAVDRQLPAVVSQPSSAIILKYETERVVIQTSSDTPGYLIFTDTHYPGWSAALDAQPVEIEVAYGLFRAVALPAGAHMVEFRFDPPSLKLGAVISAISLLTLIALMTFSLRTLSLANATRNTESTTSSPSSNL